MPPRFASYLRDFLSENGGPGELPETPNVYVSVVNLKDQVLLQRAYAKVQQFVQLLSVHGFLISAA